MRAEAMRVALVCATGCVLVLPLAARVARRQLDVFEPIVVFALTYAVMFVARPAWMIAHHHLAYDGPAGSTDVTGGFTKMLFLSLLGAAAFVSAYETSLGHRLARRCSALGDVSVQRVTRLAIVVGLTGILSFFVFLASSSGLSTLMLILRGRSSALSQDVQASSFYLWYSFFLLVPATLLLLAVGLERRKKALVGIALLFGAIFLFRTVPLGARIAILPLAGGAFVFSYLRRGARPSAVVLVTLALVAVVGSAFLSDLRGRGTRGENVAQTIVRSMHPDRFVSFISSPDAEMAPVLAAAVAEIPKPLDYTYGRTIFGDLVSRPIPRALWAGKPELPRDKLIGSLWPVESRKGGINPEFSVLLYFYWDFGVPGVLAGMFLFGVAMCALYRYFLAHEHTLGVQVLFALSLWFIPIGLRNSPVDTTVQFMVVVFPAWLILRLSRTASLRVAPAMPT